MVEVWFPWRVLLAVVLVATALTLGGPLVVGGDTTRYQSTSACHVCTTDFAFQDETPNESVAVTDWSFALHVEPNGSLRRVATVRVNESFVDHVRSTPAVRTRLLDRARRTAHRDVSGLSLRVTGPDELTFTYYDRSDARVTPSGAVVVTEFGIQQDLTRYGARDLTLVAPSGWVVAHERNVDGNQERSSDRRTTISWGRAGSGRMHGGTYVALAPERSIVTQVDAALAVVTHTTPYVLDEALRSGVPLGLAFGVVFAACLAIGGRPDRTRYTWVSQIAGVAIAVPAVAGTLLFFDLWTQQWPRGQPFPIFGLAFTLGVFAFGAWTLVGSPIGGFEAARRRVGALVAVPAVAAVLSGGSAISAFAPFVALVVVAFYLGAHARPERRWFFGAMLVVGHPVALLPLVPTRITDTPMLGFAVILLPLLVLGVPAYLVGANEPVESTPASESDGA
jgi:hypothetical protein